MRYTILLILFLTGCSADPTAVIEQLKPVLRAEVKAAVNTEIAGFKTEVGNMQNEIEEVGGDVANMKTTIGGGGDSITAWIYAVMPIPLSVLFYTLFFKPVLYWLGLRKREATRADLEQIHYRLEHANWSQGHFDLSNTPDSKGTTQ